MPELNKVADIYLVQEGDQIVGVEVGFNQNVHTKLGAAVVLNNLFMKQADAAWTYNTIARVQDAPTDQQPDEGGDTSPESIEDTEQTADA